MVKRKKPCPKGSARNQKTQRCRKRCKPASTRSTKSKRCLKPCKPDSERNKRTNRCRKRRKASQKRAVPKPRPQPSPRPRPPPAQLLPPTERKELPPPPQPSPAPPPQLLPPSERKEPPPPPPSPPRRQRAGLQRHPKIPPFQWLFGSTHAAITQLMFLAEIHTDDCVVIPDFDDIAAVDRWDFSFWWDERSDPPKFFIPNLTQKYEDCWNDPRKRFILMPLVITWHSRGKDNDHSNMLIYDRVDNTIERFEPHGTLSVGSPTYYSNAALDVTLAYHFRAYGAVYLSPVNYCPRLGPQTMEATRQELAELFPDTPPIRGYCQAWTFWYAHLRMQYPDPSRNELIVRAIQQLERYPGRFTQFIADYGSFWADIQQSIKDPEFFRQRVRDFQEFRQSVEPDTCVVM